MKLSAMILASLTAGVVGAYAAPIVSGNLLVNGSFENNGGNLIADYGNWETYSSISGWTNTGNVVEIQNNGLFGGVAANGSNWTELDSHGSLTLSQSVATTAGSLYTLTFAYAGRPENRPDDYVLALNINGSTTTLSTAPSSGSLNWTYASYSFISTGADLIAFSDGGPSNSYGILIDDVSLTTAAVPEPGTFALCALGLSGLVVFARRRSRTA